MSAKSSAKDLAASLATNEDNTVTPANLASNPLNTLQAGIDASNGIIVPTNVDIKLPDGFTVIEDSDAEAFLAWKLSQGKLTDLTKEEVAEIKGTEKSGPILMEFFDILVDSITGHSERPEEMNVSILKGRVSAADLDVAGVDKAWLIKIGAIESAGLHYG